MTIKILDQILSIVIVSIFEKADKYIFYIGKQITMIISSACFFVYEG